MFVSCREVVAKKLEPILVGLLVDQGRLVRKLDRLQLRVGPGGLDLTGVVPLVDELELWGDLGFIEYFLVKFVFAALLSLALDLFK